MSSGRVTSKRTTVNSPDSTRSTAVTSHRTRSTAAASSQPATAIPQSPAYTAHDAKTSDSSGTPSPSSESVSETSTSQLSTVAFAKIFNRVYQKFYNVNKISTEEEKWISSQEVDLDEFDRLTQHKQYARYISLLDGRIIFHQVPNAPHGEVIDCLVFSIHSQMDRNMFLGAVDNGIIPQIPSLLCRLCIRYETYKPL